MNRQHGRLGLGAGLATLAVMAVAGCSGGGGGSHGGALPGAGSIGLGHGSAISMVADVMTQASKADTVRMTGTVTTTGAHAMTASMAAQEQYSPSLAMSMNMSVMGQNVSEVLIGTTVYMRYPALSSMTQGKPWAEIDLSKAGGALGSMASVMSEAKNYNPTTQLSALLASGQVTEVGKETVDGRQATHYRGTLSAAQVSALTQKDDHLSSSQVGTLQDAFKTSGLTSETIDLWIGSTDLPVRIKVAAHGTAVSMQMDMHLSDWGAPVSVGAPPAGQVYDITSLLGSLDSND